MLSSLKPINLGIAISGGGYRSFLNGAGALVAFDDRTLNSTMPGHLGGILQSTSYISAISGGSWLLMSFVLSDFEPVVRMTRDWKMIEPLLEGIPNLQQIEVSRNDVQVLPNDFEDDDPRFYEELHKIGKRSWDENTEDEIDDNKDTFSQELFHNDDYLDEVFEAFYQNLELIPHLDDDEDDDGDDGDDEDDDEEDNENQDDNDLVPLTRLSKRTTSQKANEDWFDNFKTFFKDMFKKKEEIKISATHILPNIDVSPDLSMKNLKKIFNFYKNLHVEVRSKKSAGFPVSFTDYWGRALSRKIFPKYARAPDNTFSNVINLPSFKKFQQPLPIIVTNSREPGVEKTSITSTIFEFTPFEFGSWDLKLFTNLKYLGSYLCKGDPVFHLSKRAICFNNFDNSGFITGTSSSLFNNVLIYVWQLAASSTKDKYRAIKAVLNTFGLTSKQDGIDPKKHPDYALYTPNPFYKFGDQNTNEVHESKHLYMVDGGEDGQNIPLQPLLQKNRNVDLIFAIDSTADVGGWPNGTILRNTWQRYNDTRHNGVTVSIDGAPRTIDLFPLIPTPNIFMNKKLNTKPVFFGCHLSQYPKRSFQQDDIVDDYLPPIIGYYGNTYHSYLSNTSTFRLTYTDDEVSKIIENSYNIMTYKNSTVDGGKYDKCIGCIMIKREFDRKQRNLSLMNDMELPKFCSNCYNEYCYN
ncbi:putative meiotic phospholipase [Wickerhamomyces ciferrii]|uniref:Lysophospholipase n=1 Tax=Wickerhamomyces ciferrii (strain ATCC 14091 / BCRC 22168 / CBS 111 / JCM 3599 / NBRC 0793 / NRRL Y-1031 F-60-10) TaxID=1206466 RepID=K0KJN3_WICCF|nr:putative meiotic phospholipase [Wickerhamomyces ciferrii]CCH41293.1 putative meiotic phospholipase [Wickerhamomyces ciferrii]